MTFKLGTRGSALALAQSNMIAARLRALGHEVELVKIVTSGDRFQAETPAEAAAKLEGGKGLFVKEIEDAMLRGEIDLAVHSAKDLPGELAPGLTIAAYPEREDASDVLIARAKLADLPAGAKVGTSSPRRRLQLQALRPDLEFVPMRGNVDTRLRKLAEGAFDGIVLAKAGLVRLGRTEPYEVLSELVSAPGQGALAIEARADRVGTLSALAALDDARCRVEVEAERLFQAAVGGGCLTPLGARAELDGAWLRLQVFFSVGRSPARLSARTKAEPEKIAASVQELAGRVRQIAAS